MCIRDRCAVVSSGIRGGSKQAIRGAKHTARARRKALAEAPAQAHGQFATTEAGTKLDAIEQAQIEAEREAATKSKKRSKKSAGTQAGGDEKPPAPQTVRQATAADNVDVAKALETKHRSPAEAGEEQPVASKAEGKAKHHEPRRSRNINSNRSTDQAAVGGTESSNPVSYTHLTLPTICSV